MSKQTPLMMKKRANNERAAVCEVKTFMCYFCGDIYTTLLEYQRHTAFAHQIPAIGYQIWNHQFFQQNETHSKRRSKNSETRKSSETRKTSETRNSNATTTTKRAIDPDFVEPTKPATKKRRTSNAEEMKKAALQAAEKKSAAQAEKKKKDENKKPAKKEKKKKDEVTVPSTKILRTDPVTRKSIELETVASPTGTAVDEIPSKFVFNSSRECSHKNCSHKCLNFFKLVEHYISAHKAQILTVHINVFKDKTRIAIKKCAPGDGCARCELKFTSEKLYLMHLVDIHCTEVAKNSMNTKYTDANNANIQVTIEQESGEKLLMSYNVKAGPVVEKPVVAEKPL